MKPWSVQDAKARFSELLDTCVADGPQMVTKRGEEAAVLVPVQTWRRMESQNKPTLKELLLSKHPVGDIPEFPRHKLKRKPPIAFE